MPTSSLVEDSLRAQGYSQLRGVLDDDICTRLHADATQSDLESARRLFDTASPTAKPIHSSGWRHNIMLSATEAVREAAQCLFDIQQFRTAVAALLGRDATVYELAAMQSLPGAQAQPLHRDTLFSPACEVLTVFIALTDVPDENWGPTAVVPATHDKACWHYHDLHSPACPPGSDGCLHATSARPVCLARGDALVIDSRVFHCGGQQLHLAPTPTIRSLLLAAVAVAAAGHLLAAHRRTSRHIIVHGSSPSQVPTSWASACSSCSR